MVVLDILLMTHSFFVPLPLALIMLQSCEKLLITLTVQKVKQAI